MRERGWMDEMFDALDAEGVAGLFPYLHEDVAFRFGSFPPGRGREAFDRAWRQISPHVDSISHELLDTWESSESAVCRGNVTYRTTDERSITVPFANVFYLRDGKIAEYLIYVDASAVFGPSQA